MTRNEIPKSDNGEYLEHLGLISRGDSEYFFSRRNQKIYTFEVARALFVDRDLTAGESITQAQDFIQESFERIFKKKI